MPCVECGRPLFLIERDGICTPCITVESERMGWRIALGYIACRGRRFWESLHANVHWQRNGRA